MEAVYYINSLNAELNFIRHLLALAEAHHFVDVSRIRVKNVFKILIAKGENEDDKKVNNIKNRPLSEQT
jgi:hypothetical protein